MSHFEDLTGEKFGMLEVLELIRKSPTKWLCRCDCGKMKIARSFSLKNGLTTHCGCSRPPSKIKHDKSHTPPYNAWTSIKTRCYNKNSEAYKYYGGRGIKMQENWINDAKLFMDYISELENYGLKGYSLDRIDNNGDYCEGNIKFSTIVEQNRNRRMTKVSPEMVAEIKRMYPEYTQKDIAKKFNLSRANVSLIINNKAWKDL